MKIIGLLSCLAALGACNTPPLGYAGIDPERVSIGKSTFDVRLKDGQAQAIRINSEFAPNLNYVAPRARCNGTSQRMQSRGWQYGRRFNRDQRRPRVHAYFAGNGRVIRL